MVRFPVGKLVYYDAAFYDQQTACREDGRLWRKYINFLLGPFSGKKLKKSRVTKKSCQ